MSISAIELMSLLNIPNVGVSRVRKILLRRIQDLESNCSADEAAASAVRSVLSPEQIQKLPDRRRKAQEEHDALSRAGTHILAIGDRRYPASLIRKLGAFAPLILLCKGNLDLFSVPSVGFCGSRSASEKGIAAAWNSATSLARAKVNVVSGYAAGVDIKAHEAALSAGGTTTVVLAEGLLRFRVKKDVRQVWDEARVLVVSKFGARCSWSVGNAMQRNKTICALSQALILIEAREQGGSIAAGRECLKLNMPLFAAVYDGSPESSRGNDAVLGIGARRLMKSRATNLPNLSPVLDIVLHQNSDSAAQSVIALQHAS